MFPKSVIGYSTLFLNSVIGQWVEFYAEILLLNSLHNSEIGICHIKNSRTRKYIFIFQAYYLIFIFRPVIFLKT